ncbi:sigma-70 family RNA polymerase sigma factor [Hyalangium versicolor]|uniref:sigma-70 family RNA polymerase sigma factor n=1 Tax=Hyalangium versicolor TaxID=2861190 RepID=UPI001CCEE510|nr:sigma-70 family RNA polymerase sigma factor [Hyalangium versicolor]
MPTSPSELVQAFVAGAARPCPPEELEALGGLLVESLSRCQQAWPEVNLAPEVFASHLGKCLPPGEAPVPGLRALLCEDLYLALAALQEDRSALAALERTVFAPVERAVQRVDAAEAFVDEVMQLTRLRLLVGETRHGPRLGDYAGKGPLRRWTEAVAVGVAVSLKRRPDRTTPLDDAMIESELGTTDAELSLLRQRYRPAFRAAFAEALSGLSARERNLLRLSLAQGLGVEALGALHQVHASTVSRWLAHARSKLLEGTRGGLARRLALDPSQVDSIIRVLDGHLELSFSALLKQED